MQIFSLQDMNVNLRYKNLM